MYLKESSDEEKSHNSGIDQRTAIEVHAYGVDEEEFELLRHLDEAGHESEEHQSHDHERDEQGYQRLDEIHIVPFAIGEDEDDGGDTEEVKEVDSDADTHHVCYQDEIAVGVGEISSIFPLQDEPEHQCGAE